MGICIRMDPSDNMAMVLQRSSAGEAITILDRDMKQVGEVTPTTTIPFAHKVCISDITKGCLVRKFGAVIVRATEDISVGNYAHIHNIVSIEGFEKVVKGETAK